VSRALPVYGGASGRSPLGGIFFFGGWWLVVEGRARELSGNKTARFVYRVVFIRLSPAFLAIFSRFSETNPSLFQLVFASFHIDFRLVFDDFPELDEAADDPAEGVPMTPAKPPQLLVAMDWTSLAVDQRTNSHVNPAFGGVQHRRAY
jgi:hypothetical protein